MEVNFSPEQLVDGVLGWPNTGCELAPACPWNCMSAISRLSGVLPIGVIGKVSSACDFSHTILIL